MIKIIVMLIWAGGYRGGPATITGFETMEACREAMPIVEEAYDKRWSSGTVTECVELPRGVKPMGQP